MKRRATTVLTLILFAFSGCVTGGAAQPAAIEPAVEPVNAVIQTEPAAAASGQSIADITPGNRGKVSEMQRQIGASVGWLVVPGTDIDTVVVQNPKGDNNYYTTHNIYGSPDKNGAYGADHRSNLTPGTRGTISRNTTIYAHNHDEDPDGELFAQLKRYKDPAFARANPYIYFSTAGEDMVWEIFAIFDATVHLPYVQADLHWNAYSIIADIAYQASIYDYGVTISDSDRILTLSTCSFDIPGVGRLSVDVPNDYRFIVMARLLEPGEPVKESAAFTVRSTVLGADDIPYYKYLNSDVFFYQGLAAYNNAEMFDSSLVQSVDRGNLNKIGTIKRSGVFGTLEDWDATSLDVGTAIYQDKEHPDTLVAEVGGSLIPYRLERDSYNLTSAVLTLREGDSVVATKVLSGQSELSAINSYAGVLHPLTDRVDSLGGGSDKRSITLQGKDSLKTATINLYLATPPSLGEEVVIVETAQGNYYMAAQNFEQIVGIIRS